MWKESYQTWKGETIQAFKDTWDKVGNNITETIDGIWQNIVQPLTDLKQWITAKVASIMEFDLSGWLQDKWNDNVPFDMMKIGGSEHNDFVWRPGTGIEKFSSDDTLVGLKDTSKLSEIGSNREGMNLQIAELRAIKEGLAPLMNIAQSSNVTAENSKNLKPTTDGA